MSNIQNPLHLLESSGLVYPSQLEPELEYLFKHALVQEAAYDSLLKADRKLLHKKVGQAIEVKFSGRLDELLGTLTYHYNQAEEWEKSLHYSERAAAQYKLNFANEEALAYFQVAITAAEKIISSADVKIKTAMLEKIFGILSERQGVWVLLGQFDSAQSDLDQMVHIARDLRDDARLADALNGLGYFYLNFSANDPQPFLREALEIKRRIGDKAGEADGLNTLASVLISNGNAVNAMQFYKDARKIYESLNSEDGIARSDWSIGLAEYELFGNYEYARKLFESSMVISQRLGMKNLECGNVMMLGANHVRMGQIEIGELNLAKALEMAIQIGDYPAQGWIALYRGWAMREKQKYNEAIDLIEGAVKIAEEKKISNLDWYGRYSLGQIKLLDGRPRDGLVDARYVYEISRNLYVWVDVRCRSTALLAQALSALNDHEQASIHAVEALDELEKFGASSVSEVAGVYLGCYKVLRVTHPDLAKKTLKMAYEKVMGQGSSLSAESAKKSFFDNVQMHKEIITLSIDL